MKSLVFSLAVLMFLVQLTSGNLSTPKCANRTGRCRTRCRVTEWKAQPSFQTCRGKTHCCVKEYVDPILFCIKTTIPTMTVTYTQEDLQVIFRVSTESAKATISAATETTTSAGTVGSKVSMSATTTTSATSTATTTGGG